MKKAKELIQVQLDLLFECPIFQHKELNYTEKDELIVLILLNEINKRLLALTLLNKGDL